MSDTIFTRIMRGEMPSHRVYEDEYVFAFLDIAPLSQGHTLVVPREPAPTLDRLSDEAAAGLGRALPRLCRAVQAATGATDYNVLQNNGVLAYQAVPHVHFHIIPRQAEAGLGLDWPAGHLDPEAGAVLARKIAAQIR